MSFVVVSTNILVMDQHKVNQYQVQVPTVNHNRMDFVKPKANLDYFDKNILLLFRKMLELESLIWATAKKLYARYD